MINIACHTMRITSGISSRLGPVLWPQICLRGLQSRGWYCGCRAGKYARVTRSPRRIVIAQGTGAESDSEQIRQLRAFTTTSIYRYWIQGAVFLIVLAGIDAAYSGDWSRTGVISRDFENSLKPLVAGLGVFHIGCAVVAGRDAASKNLRVAPAVVKVLAVGFLAMVEVLAAEPQTEGK